MDTRDIGPLDNDTVVDALCQVVASRSELAELWAEAANWSQWRQDITPYATSGLRVESCAPLCQNGGSSGDA
ncbi:hypothetical protein [Streptomyces rubiginosohelvolus]|uniref:hypothetical protein n=1 Tax=Streptomyces rubiginosohelvolus TaxID=67362 RepID=UPI0036544D56